MEWREAGIRTSLFFDQALLPSGWAGAVRLQLDDGRIVAIEKAAAARPGEERHGCALPGMPNLHSHAFQRGLAGLTEWRGSNEDSFWTWRELMYRFVDRLTPDDLTALAELAYVEMLETGFTRVGEFHYLHHDRDGRPYADPAEMSAAIAAAAGGSGIGLTLLPVFYAHAGFGGLPSQPNQARFVCDLDGYARLLDAAGHALAILPDAVLGTAPHSLRAVTPEQLATVASLRPGAPIHIHVAEQVREVEDCLRWSGQRPVEWLLSETALDSRWCLVHATHMTSIETDALARSGAIAGLCPVTEANLGDGLFPASAFLDAGGGFGIGSDSNVLIDTTEELRLLEYGQRLALQRRNVLASPATERTGERLFNAAVAGGAAALGVDAGLVVGAAADIVSLDLAHPSLACRPREALLDGFVFSAGRGAIDCVWRGGEKQVTRGRHRDRARVVARYVKALERLTG